MKDFDISFLNIFLSIFTLKLVAYRGSTMNLYFIHYGLNPFKEYSKEYLNYENRRWFMIWKGECQ